MTILIEKEIEKIEKEKVHLLNDDEIREIFSVLIDLDKDLHILLQILQNAILEMSDQHLKSLYVIKILKFYGINNKDILSCRHKYFVENGLLIKKPFLKKQQKEMIEILLQQMNVEVF